MILTHLPAGTVLYRALTPRWASRPASGAGAAAKGGRFNREGVEALYLSLEELAEIRPRITRLRDGLSPLRSYRGLVHRARPVENPSYCEKQALAS
jgi:RES domain-containing protein